MTAEQIARALEEIASEMTLDRRGPQGEHLRGASLHDLARELRDLAWEIGNEARKDNVAQ